MTRKGSFTAAMAGFAALLAAAAVVQAAPKPKTEEAAGRLQGQDRKPTRRPRPTRRRRPRRRPTTRPAPKKADKKSDKKAAKTAEQEGRQVERRKLPAKSAVPLPKRRPADSATVTGAFPTPIGTAPILSSGLRQRQPAVDGAAVRRSPQREAALTPPTSQRADRRWSRLRRSRAESLAAREESRSS